MSKSNFNKVAPYYDFLAKLVFGKSIRRAQRTFLTELTDNSRVLIIGGGTGWVLDEISNYSTPYITYIDSSSKMISRSKRRNYPGDKIEFITGNESHIPAHQYDVVVTHFFLDMFDGKELSDIIFTLDKALKMDGRWLFCDFDPDIQKSGNILKRGLLKFMYWFFRVTCKINASRLMNYEEMFRQLGYLRKDQKHFYSKMIVARLYRKS